MHDAYCDCLTCEQARDKRNYASESYHVLAGIPGYRPPSNPRIKTVKNIPARRNNPVQKYVITNDEDGTVIRVYPPVKRRTCKPSATVRRSPRSGMVV